MRSTKCTVLCQGFTDVADVTASRMRNHPESRVALGCFASIAMTAGSPGRGGTYAAFAAAGFTLFSAIALNWSSPALLSFSASRSGASASVLPAALA